MNIEIVEIARFSIHYGLHLIFPAFLAWLLFRKFWKKAWVIMIATMMVDLDHLFSNPIFVADRCSIGFHPLHSYYAIGTYILLMAFPNQILRIICIGLLLHMVTDYLDCFLMQS